MKNTLKLYNIQTYKTNTNKNYMKFTLYKMKLNRIYM